MKIFNPSVKIQKKIYVKRLFEPITLEKITKMLSKCESAAEESYSAMSSNEKDNGLDEIFEKNENKLKIRLICDTPFTFPHKKEITSRQSMFELFNCCTNRKLDKIHSEEKEKNDFEAILLHVHGGGFVSQSSSSHQIYTRE